MNDETTLLPCPFCSGEASKRLFYNGKYRVHCNVCDAHSGDVCETESEAIAAWNARTTEYAVAATLGDDEYEAKMDALLCNLTNGKFSKSRSYSLDFMESCVNEEFEELYAKELADAMLGNGTLTAEQVREAIEKRFDFDVWVPPARWQAIADELNAELRKAVKR